MTEDFQENIKGEELLEETSCPNCGAVLKYKPGSTSLHCEYCDTTSEIEQEEFEIEEIDFKKFLAEMGEEEKQEVLTVKCDSCGASVTFDPNISSDQCPFCGTPLVVKGGTSSNVIKPKSLLPFKIEKNDAYNAFRKWIKKLWFAPSGLKKYAHSAAKFAGVYIPFWTYDSQTNSRYSGSRGTYYYTTQTYTTTQNGKTVTRTRQVRHIRWTPVSGTVDHFFDDLLIPASHSLPKKYLNKLEPWDLPELKPFDEKFLSGYRTETAQVGIEEGYQEAKGMMEKYIRQLVRRNIGGDQQRIHKVNTSFSDISFKHLLLPVYISSYRFKEKVYRFMVNGRTGEVQGERPYSAWKIIFTVLGGLAVIALIYWLYTMYA